MPTELYGVLVVPLIMGLVGTARGAGMPGNWAAPLSLALGLALSLGYQASQPVGSGTWFQAVLIGLALGLSASGLYSGVKKTVGR